jgi:hypothetical protein
MKKLHGLLLLSVAVIASLASCGGTSSATAAVSSTSESVTSASTSTSTNSSSTSTQTSSNTSHSGGPGGGGGSTTSVTYAGATTFTSDATEADKTYASTTADQSAVLVQNGANVTLTAPTVTKSGDTSSADNSSFYGVNASVLTTSGNVYLKNGTINSTAEGGAGICGYSSSGKAYAAGTKITTTANAAGGVHACGGGYVYGWDLDVNTAGEHSAAIRSDRGGGTMRLDGGSYHSTGSGSPAIYSTADIAVNDATLTADGSEGVSIEGKNSVRIFNSTMTSQMADSSQNSNVSWGVILYQSNSGDSTSGKSEFALVDSTIDIKQGDGAFFATTGTSSDFLVSGSTFKHTGNSAFDYIFRATAIARWDKAGSTTNFTASGETAAMNMTGNVIYDTASNMTMYLKDSSVWTGAAVKDTTYTGSYAPTMYIEAGSKWIVNANSTFGNIYNAGSIVDSSGNDVKVVDSSGNVLRAGTSSYTVTLSGTYAATVSTSGAIATPAWSSYAVTKPTALA